MNKFFRILFFKSNLLMIIYEKICILSKNQKVRILILEFFTHII
jgi:hypothetical protein